MKRIKEIQFMKLWIMKQVYILIFNALIAMIRIDVTRSEFRELVLLLLMSQKLMPTRNV
jgi:hypothetical protein